jgi:hypothetical protein
MNSARYEELLARLLEGELSDAEGKEMAEGLGSSEILRQDLRRHLVLWELWSQQEAPERSPEAFVRAWNTRLRAETENADDFPGALQAQLQARQPALSVIEYVRQFLGRRRRAGVAWAASLVIVGLACVLWFAATHSAHAVTTLEGEAVCTACVLHESHEHAPAMRVVTGTATNIYYLDRNPDLAALQDYFCSGPNAATAEGTKRTRRGQLLFRATTVNIPAANQPREESTNSARIIFPF